jgi:two-component system invasion response regulator UvrY
MRILLADDHPIVRQGVRRILAEALPHADFLEAGDAALVLEHYASARFDAIVLDLSLPGNDGLDLLKHLRRLDRLTPIVVLSLHPESQYAVRALKAGAAAYLSKECAPSDLVAALRRALAGGKYINPALADRLLAQRTDETDGTRHEKLSDREYQVLTLIASGKTVSEVAGQLTLSVKTVSTYRGRILEKMGMKTNAELTYYAVKSGLV